MVIITRCLSSFVDVLAYSLSALDLPRTCEILYFNNRAAEPLNLSGDSKYSGKMSGFTDEAVKQKLSALNESQDSIVTVAQWLMFHRRQAVRTAELWLQKMKDPSTTASKKLSLMYLANEMVQQSKLKKKDDILAAFSTLIGEGMIIAYKSAPPDVQNKLKRTVEVWRQRNILDQASQEAIEAQIMGMSSHDTNKATPSNMHDHRNRQVSSTNHSQSTWWYTLSYRWRTYLHTCRATAISTHAASTLKGRT